MDFKQMPKPVKWTELAKECYERGCICNGCVFSEILISSNCRMKRTVLELVKLFGVPNE